MSDDFFDLSLSWKRILRDELKDPRFLKLINFIKSEIDENKELYPPLPLVF